MAFWNYRVVRRVNGDEDDFSIHEVYYVDRESEKILQWSENAVEPSGVTLEDLMLDIKRMQEASERPVLEYDELPGSGVRVVTSL